MLGKWVVVIKGIITVKRGPADEVNVIDDVNIRLVRLRKDVLVLCLTCALDLIHLTGCACPAATAWPRDQWGSDKIPPVDVATM